MSLKKYELEETAVLHLRDGNDALMYVDNADGAPNLALPMRVTLYGPGSKQFARAINDKQNHSLDLMKEKGKTKEGVDEAVAIAVEYLAACTVAFENVASESGATGRALALEIYSNQRLSYIRDQVLVFISQHRNFTKGSPTS